MKLLCASFPRSGSQFLVDGLRAAMGDRLKWCEGYEEPFLPDHHNMLKTHDFSLTDSPHADWGVIVQLRHPLDAIPSWFEVQLKYGDVTDDYESWIRWARQAFVFWSKFVRKWVLNSHTEMVILHYNLVRHPNHYIEHIAWLLTGDAGMIAPDVGVRPHSNHKAFRYYREEDFAFFQSLCLTEMRILGYAT
jgi:hypothetical protein